MLDEYRRDDALRHLQRGIVLERAHRIKEAVNEYRQALVYDPHLREAHDALGFYYQRCGMLARAADEFRIAAHLDGDFLSFFNLGYVLAEVGQYESALEAFERCLLLRPDDPATHYEMSFIHFRCGNFRAAVDQLQVPLCSYPEDWELHQLLGRCHLGLHCYDDAQHAFTQALLLTDHTDAQADLLNSITTVERHREFRNLGSTKDQLYATEGVVVLGSAQDDGLHVAEAHDYHFTYPDIGTTLQRLLALQQGYRWNFTVVVALDKLAQPLAAALAQMTNLPLRCIDDLLPSDVALLVLGVARTAELLQLTAERIACSSATFCLGLNWLRHSKRIPELIGIAARNACSVPWESELRRLRRDGAPASQVAECIGRATAQILAAVSETPLDTNLPRQVRYYTRTHRRLSFPIASGQSTGAL